MFFLLLGKRASCGGRSTCKPITQRGKGVLKGVRGRDSILNPKGGQTSPEVFFHKGELIGIVEGGFTGIFRHVRPVGGKRSKGT